MRHRRLALRIAAVTLLAPILASCASVESVETARGTGVKRTFKYPYDDVSHAVLMAIEKRKLHIAKYGSTRGTLLLTHGVSVTSLGEHIAVFLTPVGERATSVEVVVQPVLSAITFPPDWPALLFGEIEEALAARRVGK